MSIKRCSHCGDAIVPAERAAIETITVCLPCAEAGLYDRTPHFTVGQHKGQPLICSPEQAADHSYRK